MTDPNAGPPRPRLSTAGQVYVTLAAARECSLHRAPVQRAQKRTSTMNTKDFADIKRMSIIDYLKYDQQEWPAWRKRIAALREEAKASGDQEMVDLCYLADSGDEDAVATIVQYLDDIAEDGAEESATEA